MESLELDIKKLANKQQSLILQRFFKTGKGEYGHGDIFLGIKVPETRKLADKYWQELTIDEVQELLNSKIHEKRLLALLILINKYNSSDETTKEKFFNFYLSNKANINNWDLIDLSAPHIVGDFLLNKDRKILYQLAKSKDLWERRISILSTYKFIKNNQFDDTLKISETLLKDKHDLIHKAAGWMLREVGKKSIEAEEEFLKKHHKKMPRTMLRYAIEKFPEEKRKAYLLSQD
ncbi:MAG TPA: DNA alkylation repair protein [Candidatus Nanoarchaeia archaeon]|nr:DNA alkylation repair protein [Candidatus Nanoarchaeia archaeon]